MVALANEMRAVSFGQQNLRETLDAMSDPELDAVGFGVIGIDSSGVVTRYNEFEARQAGLLPSRVIGRPLFSVIAPCMNNEMVAEPIEVAMHEGGELDAVLDYVLALRMKPVKVKLRLLAGSTAPNQRTAAYVVIDRAA